MPRRNNNTKGIAYAIIFLLSTARVPYSNAEDTTTLATCDKIVRVELDWEFRVTEPSDVLSSPELVFVITPFADTSNTHSLFTINHGNDNGHFTGGFQNQIWTGSKNETKRKGPRAEKLLSDGETISFTHSMCIDSSTAKITFDVTNLRSTTWGDIETDFVTLSMDSTLQNLNDFSLESVIAESGVSDGANRVSYIRLNKTRVYYEDNSCIDTCLNLEIHKSLTGTISISPN